MPEAPQGTLTFLFTDIVGSTKLWEKFPQTMGAALARHDALIRAAVEEHRGHVFKTVGDALCVSFATPGQAVQSAIDAQKALMAASWETVGSLAVRMGIHTGTAEFRDGDYFGGTLNRVARIEAAAHGQQILISQITCDLLRDEDLPGIEYKSLGDHRLRNLERPEHLYQVVADHLPKDFPSPKSMEVLPNNLPIQATSFIGRDHEMTEVAERLQRTRLLTLTGTGGTGKTRLSLEAGARVINDFRDGVWLVELAPISDPGLLPEVVAGTLGVREDPEKPVKDSLLSFLKSKTILIILDNCEHLLAAAASLVGDILRTCPNVRVLATSRHSLGVSGEMTLPVPPLGTLDVRLYELTGPNIVERLSQYDAVRLFIERALAVRPDFVVTNKNAPALAEVCSRLDGIPLAIELAAARIRVLDIEQIAARLSDRFRLLRGANTANLPHQQTLQALIDWSHDLLSDQERVLFRRLGVFVGGRTLESLEAVCSGDGIEDFEVLDLLQQLVDKSLASVERDAAGNTRYTFIESVWQYARQKLAESGENETLRDRHLAYFLGLAEKASPMMEGPKQKAWLDRCQSEMFNFRAAFERALDTGQTEVGYRMMSALYRFIEIRSNLEETRELSVGLMKLPEDNVPAIHRANVRISMGRLSWASDRYEEARKHYKDAQEIFDSIGDETGSGLASMLLAFLDRGNGDQDAAEAGFERALKIGRKHKHLYLEAGAMSGLGSIALDKGDLKTARDLKEQSLAIYEKLGDHWIRGLILWGLTQVAIVQEDYARAKTALADWTQITKDLGNKWILPYVLECYAELAVGTGEGLKAARCFGAAEAQREHFNAQFSVKEQSQHEASVASLTKMLPPEELRTAWEAGRQESPWEVISKAKF